jgi:uncharacterized protein (DUF433 family)
MNEAGPIIDIYRTGKAYTVAQAARLAGTTPATVRRWLFGYDSPGHQMVPVFGDRPARAETPIQVSFLELVEIIVVARFRTGVPGRTPVKLERLRRAHEFARMQFGLPYPFATLKLRQYGGHILHKFDEEFPGPGFLALDVQGQWVLPTFVEQTIEQFDFDDEFASRWYPYGKDVPVVLDPHYAGGQPSIHGRGLMVDIIHRRWKAGQHIAFIARDFELPPAVVEKAIRLVA